MKRLERLLDKTARTVRLPGGAMIGLILALMMACRMPPLKFLARQDALPNPTLTALVSTITAAASLPAPASTALLPRESATPTALPPTPIPVTLVPTPKRLPSPLYWFAPLPPLPTGSGRPFTGAEDFLGLFQPTAAWEQAARRIQVFKLYGEWVAYQASDEELRQVVAEIQRRGLALAVEAGPLTPPEGCGQGIEGFAGLQEGLQIARRIQQAGGVLHLLAMDEPYYFGHFYDGPNACRWTDMRIAQEIGAYIHSLRSIFPELIVGDTEPLAGPAGAPQYQAWMVAFRAVNGYDLAFLHLDIDWSRPDWPAEVLSIEQFGRERGIPVGLIYTGNFSDSTDEAWLSIAGERVKRYELESGGLPEQVLFQSWHDKPDRLLPESEPYTFTGLIRAYFEDKTLLGMRNQGAGANLAYRKPVRYSKALPDNPGSLAVDGDPGTWWSAGDFKPQWIEIDLGQEYTIQSIRLLPSQSPAGQTVHRLFGRGEEKGASLFPLHSLEGITQDGQPLAFTPAEPWPGVRYLRIETLASPSWVAWREIEVIDSGGQ